MKTKAKRPTKKAKKLNDYLADIIAKRIKELELTQTSASHRMRVAPSQISLAVTGKLRGFSTVRLLKMGMALGVDFELAAMKTNWGTVNGRVIGSGTGKFRLRDMINRRPRKVVSA